jgi:hypothetical protein
LLPKDFVIMANIELETSFRPLRDFVFNQRWRADGGRIQVGYSLDDQDFFTNISEKGDVYFGVIPSEDETRFFPTAVFVTEDAFGARPRTIYQAEVEASTKKVISRTKIDCSLGRPTVFCQQDVPWQIGYVHPLRREKVPTEDLWVVIYDGWRTNEKWEPIKREQIIRQVTYFPRADSQTEGFAGNRVVLEESVFLERPWKGGKKPVVWREEARRFSLEGKEYYYYRGIDGILRLLEHKVPEEIPSELGRAQAFVFYDSLSRASAASAGKHPNPWPDVLKKADSLGPKGGIIKVDV